MTNLEIVSSFITRNIASSYCDDCLSKELNIKPRQQINQICRKLDENKIIIREVQKCTNCSKYKLINKIR